MKIKHFILAHCSDCLYETGPRYYQLLITETLIHEYENTELALRLISRFQNVLASGQK